MVTREREIIRMARYKKELQSSDKIMPRNSWKTNYFIVWLVLVYLLPIAILIVAFVSMASDVTWLSILDQSNIKIIYGLYLGFLGYFSYRVREDNLIGGYNITKLYPPEDFLMRDLISKLFTWEAVCFIIWGTMEYLKLISSSVFFSTTLGELVAFGSLYVPYIHGHIFKEISA